MRHWLCASWIVVSALSLTAHAQSIEIAELDSALPFQAGTLSAGQGGLDQQSWSGTSAELAVDILKNLPPRFSSSVARDLAKAAILSEGVPPEAGSPNAASRFQSVRINQALEMGEVDAVNTIVSRMAGLSRDTRLSADMALLRGDVESACVSADSVVEGRATPKWASLRAFCHVTRNEIPAAELTLDLLRSDGDFKDPAYFELMDFLTGVPGKPKLTALTTRPLHQALMQHAELDWPKAKRPQSSFAQDALDVELPNAKRLEGLFKAGDALTDDQITMVLNALSTPPTDGLAGNGAVTSNAYLFDLEGALQAEPAIGLGRLYDVAQYSQGPDKARALAEILTRADKAGAFQRFANFLEPLLMTLPVEDQTRTDLAIFAKAAVQRRDIAMLQQTYSALDGNDRAQQARIALAADAIGNGFFGGQLGSDIDSRLGSEGSAQKRAIRDALIAHALGANLSDTAIRTFADKPNQRVSIPGEWIPIAAAAEKRARAETALWAAILFKDGSEKLDDMTLFHVIQSLQKAGLFEYAGRVAAEDFLSGLES